MRTSQFFINTSKDTPAEAEVISHQLMLRAGLIRRLANGLYTWMPLGLRVLQKVESIVREEMNKSGALECLMPVVQPSELWQESGRWEQYGSELLRIHDRHNREFCLGPTHEEVITDLIRNELSSYKQLPVNFYQIQTKFRDEIRPRFGLMRAREFVMKDAYSFHLDQSCLQKTYDIMYDTYTRIFTRLGLDFRAVQADTGSIGGSASHEFHVLAETGEDDIAFSDQSDFAANIELAPTLPSEQAYVVGDANLEEFATPSQKTIEDVSQMLNCSPSDCVKTLIVQGEDDQLIALALRGDHKLNEIKAEKIEGIASPLSFASEEQVQAIIGCAPGSIGPVGLPSNVKLVVDYAAAALTNFVCGANKDGFHLKGVNWEHDTSAEQTADLRNIVEGDPSPDGKGKIVIKRGIEVGHIFQLGTKYSEAMSAQVLNSEQKQQTMTMGCYGIGVTRVIASAIEQNNDDNGIIWPQAIAPFQLAIVPINMHKSEKVKAFCEALYEHTSAAGIDSLLFDNDKARLGATLADVELIGIPHRIVVGEKSLDKGEVEYAHRTSDENQKLSSESIRSQIIDIIKNNG